ncbi:MAG: hypothetical protein P2A85_26840 [Microcoleus anatoxicus]|uniref:hypothetical protein n=1 Tax=Microcoleus anatoxicus TaxID=2705319 RepID=UPI00366B4CCA
MIQTDRASFTPDKRAGKKRDRVYYCSQFHSVVGAGLSRLSVGGIIDRAGTGAPPLQIRFNSAKPEIAATQAQI